MYCDNRTINPFAGGKTPSLEEQLRRGMEGLRRRYGPSKFIAYFQTYTATHTSARRLKEMIDEALSFEDIIGVAVSTRPDSLPGEMLDLLEGLKDLPYFWVEVGLQSIHDKTLRLLNRGHDADTFRVAVRALREREIKTCAHVIIGLPYEGREEVVETARELAALGIDGVKIHNLYVSRGTPLEKWYRESRFEPLPLGDYAERAVDFLEIMSPRTVIHRIASSIPSRYLVAPDWASSPQRIIAAVLKELEERDSRQGARYKE